MSDDETTMPANTAPSRPRPHRAMSVAGRLRTLSITLASLMLIITVVGLVGLNQIRNSADTNLGVVGPAVDGNRQIRDLMLEAQSSLRGVLMIPADQRESITGRQVAEPFRRNRAQIGSELEQLEAHVTSEAYGGGTGQHVLPRLLAQQRAAVDDWWSYARPLVEAGSATPDQFAESRRRFERFSTVSGQVDALVIARRQELRRSARDVAVTTSWSVVVATFVAMAAALFVGYRTSRQLTQPIVALRDTMSRQRAGDREVMADTTTGATEVRQLATDVNALTAAYNRFLDKQWISSRAQNAETMTSRRIRETGGVDEAVEETVVGVAEGLHLDRVACAMFSDDGGLGEVTLSLRVPDGESGESVVRRFTLPPGLRRNLGRTVAGMWAARQTVVMQPDSDDTGAMGLAVAVLGTTGAGGLVIKPFGLGERPMGVIVASYDDRRRRWYESTISSIAHIAGEVATRVVAGESETARAEHVRRLEDLDRQKNDFMSTVSHELRTPLTSISGYLEMLHDGDAGELTPEQNAMLEVVDRNALRLRALIEDLLVLNRMESVVTPSRGERVNLVSLVADTVEEIRPAAAKGRVDLRLSRPSEDVEDIEPSETSQTTGASGTVLGDRLQLGRALTNIVSNAVKFTPAGGRVDLSVRRIVDGDEPAVEVVCVDTGIGIPASDQERLFTRFFRASNATSAQVPGTGLGLVVVQGIVERHHGRLELDSEEGRGTTVRMILPVHPEARVGAAASEGASGSEASTPGE